MHGVGGAGGLECKVQGSRLKSQRLWDVNGSRPGHGGKNFSDYTPKQILPTEHKPIYSDLLSCLCKSVCIVGCWKGSLLAKRIPHMHVNNISDSNSNSNLFILKAHVVLTFCYLCWSFLPPTSAFIYSSDTCGSDPLLLVHWWSFLPPTTTFTLLPHVVVLMVLALCGGGGGTYTVQVAIYKGDEAIQ